MIKNRNGLNILRCMLGLGVTLLHISGFLLNSNFNFNNGVNGIFTLIQCVTYCSVDTFALLSGYLSKKHSVKETTNKIKNVWIQGEFYSIVFGVIVPFAVFSLNVGLKNIFKSVFIITFKTFWYLSAYVGLIILKPFIDKMFEYLDLKEKKNLLKAIVVLIGINSIYDCFESNLGYSLYWIIVLYILGKLLNDFDFAFFKQNINCILSSAICVILMYISKTIFDINHLLHYTSITNVIIAILAIFYFSSIEIKFSYNVSSYVFAIYLFQSVNYIWEKEKQILSYMAINYSKNIILVSFVFAICLCIFACIVEYIREIVIKKIKMYI